MLHPSFQQHFKLRTFISDSCLRTVDKTSQSDSVFWNVTHDQPSHRVQICGLFSFYLKLDLCIKSCNYFVYILWHLSFKWAILSHITWNISDDWFIIYTSFWHFGATQPSPSRSGLSRIPHMNSFPNNKRPCCHHSEKIGYQSCFMSVGHEKLSWSTTVTTTLRKQSEMTWIQSDESFTD